MSSAADTSIVVPALLSSHDAHDRCHEALERTSRTVAHVILEAYSVLTRLPHPFRVPPPLAAAALTRRLPEPTVTLGAAAYLPLPERLASMGLAGGSVYDAVIALTAAEHGIALLTRDARAARTYGSLGAAFELIP